MQRVSTRFTQPYSTRPRLPPTHPPPGPRVPPPKWNCSGRVDSPDWGKLTECSGLLMDSERFRVVEQIDEAAGLPERILSLGDHQFASALVDASAKNAMLAWPIAPRSRDELLRSMSLALSRMFGVGAGTRAGAKLSASASIRLRWRRAKRTRGYP